MELARRHDPERDRLDALRPLVMAAPFRRMVALVVGLGILLLATVATGELRWVNRMAVRHRIGATFIRCSVRVGASG